MVLFCTIFLFLGMTACGRNILENAQAEPEVTEPEYETVTDAKTPVYFVIGESNEYYSAEPSREAYDKIRAQYEAQGLSDEETDRLVRLDIKPMSQLGIPTEFHSYPGLRHGFGTGKGTVAEGWLDKAVQFWEKQC